MWLKIEFMFLPFLCNQTFFITVVTILLKFPSIHWIRIRFYSLDWNSFPYIGLEFPSTHWIVIPVRTLDHYSHPYIGLKFLSLHWIRIPFYTLDWDSLPYIGSEFTSYISLHTTDIDFPFLPCTELEFTSIR